MNFYDRKGNLISQAGTNGGVGYSVNLYNLWTEDCEYNVDGYKEYYGTLVEDSEHMLCGYKLDAGKTYYVFGETTYYFIHTEPFADGKLNGTKVFVGLAQTYIATYPQGKLTPDVDWYIYAPMAKAETPKFIVTEKEIFVDDDYRNYFWGFSPLPPVADDMTRLYKTSTINNRWIGQDTSVTRDFVDSVRKAAKADLYDSTLAVAYFGDSLVFAGSNVGLPNSYRNMVTKHFGIRSHTYAIAGTTATVGYGIDWTGGSDLALTGSAGFISQFGASESNENVFAEVLRQINIGVIGLGGNDFLRSAPLGTLGNGDNTTFYGGYQEIIDTIREKYGENFPIICMAVHKFNNWNTPNEQGLIIPDYNLAIHDIALANKHVYVLNFFDDEVLNYDNETIRAKGFLDPVHLSSQSHHYIAQILSEKIINVCMAEGIITHNRVTGEQSAF